MLKKLSSFVACVLMVNLLIVTSTILTAQTRETDSIATITKKSKDDTAKVNLLLVLSKKLHNTGDLDASFQYANKARDLAIKLKFIRGEAKAYNRIGNICLNFGDIPAALKNLTAALKLRKEINDRPGLASSYNDIGNAYYNQGDFSRALENYFASLKIKEELKDEKGLISVYNNIGNIYNDLGNYDEAIRNHKLSLKFSKKLNDIRGVASSFGSFGIVYYAQKKYPEALKSHLEALHIYDSLGDVQGVANAYSNIGIVYDNMGNFEEALKNNFASLALHEQAGNEQGKEMVYSNISVAYFNLKKYKLAEEYGIKALKLSKELDDLQGIKQSNDALYNVYLQLKDPNKALLAYRSFIDARDSLINEENTKKTVRLEMNYLFQKKEVADSLRAADEKKIVAVQLKQEKTQRFFLWGGLALVLVFAVFMVNRFRMSQKQKQIIEMQKKEVEHQKELVDEKQKEVLDSIKYAHRIQKALLASDNLLNENLPEYFIVYKPKDIVSGDFYWATKNNNRFYLATADSTGHGVPGAFMSLLNISFLSEAITEKGLNKPNKILDHARTRLIEALKSDGSEEGGKDGMDCILMVLDLDQNALEYSAANSGFFIIRNKEVLLFPADKMPVGKSPKDDQPFTLQTIQLQKGDIIYTMTDGLQDQFGGPKGKKFKNKQIQKLVLDNCHLSLKEQKQIVETTFNDWKGDLEQVDDVLIIGIKI